MTDKVEKANMASLQDALTTPGKYDNLNFYNDLLIFSTQSTEANQIVYVQNSSTNNIDYQNDLSSTLIQSIGIDKSNSILTILIYCKDQIVIRNHSSNVEKTFNIIDQGLFYWQYKSFNNRIFQYNQRGEINLLEYNTNFDISFSKSLKSSNHYIQDIIYNQFEDALIVYGDQLMKMNLLSQNILYNYYKINRRVIDNSEVMYIHYFEVESKLVLVKKQSIEITGKTVFFDQEIAFVRFFDEYSPIIVIQLANFELQFYNINLNIMQKTTLTKNIYEIHLMSLNGEEYTFYINSRSQIQKIVLTELAITLTNVWNTFNYEFYEVQDDDTHTSATQGVTIDISLFVPYKEDSSNYIGLIVDKSTGQIARVQSDDSIDPLKNNILQKPIIQVQVFYKDSVDQKFFISNAKGQIAAVNTRDLSQFVRYETQLVNYFYAYNDAEHLVYALHTDSVSIFNFDVLNNQFNKITEYKIYNPKFLTAKENQIVLLSDMDDRSEVYKINDIYFNSQIYHYNNKIVKYTCQETVCYSLQSDQKIIRQQINIDNTQYYQFVKGIYDIDDNCRILIKLNVFICVEPGNSFGKTYDINTGVQLKQFQIIQAGFELDLVIELEGFHDIYGYSLGGNQIQRIQPTNNSYTPQIINVNQICGHPFQSGNYLIVPQIDNYLNIDLTNGSISQQNQQQNSQGQVITQCLKTQKYQNKIIKYFDNQIDVQDESYTGTNSVYTFDGIISDIQAIDTTLVISIATANQVKLVLNDDFANLQEILIYDNINIQNTFISENFIGIVATNGNIQIYDILTQQYICTITNNYLLQKDFKIKSKPDSEVFIAYNNIYAYIYNKCQFISFFKVENIENIEFDQVVKTIFIVQKNKIQIYNYNLKQIQAEYQISTGGVNAVKDFVLDTSMLRLYYREKNAVHMVPYAQYVIQQQEEYKQSYFSSVLDSNNDLVIIDNLSNVYLQQITTNFYYKFTDNIVGQIKIGDYFIYYSYYNVYMMKGDELLGELNEGFVKCWGIKVKYIFCANAENTVILLQAENDILKKISDLYKSTSVITDLIEDPNPNLPTDVQVILISRSTLTQLKITNEKFQIKKSPFIINQLLLDANNKKIYIAGRGLETNLYQYDQNFAENDVIQDVNQGEVSLVGYDNNHIYIVLPDVLQLRIVDKNTFALQETINIKSTSGILLSVSDTYNDFILAYQVQLEIYDNTFQLLASYRNYDNIVGLREIIRLDQNYMILVREQFIDIFHFDNSKITHLKQYSQQNPQIIYTNLVLNPFKIEIKGISFYNTINIEYTTQVNTQVSIGQEVEIKNNCYYVFTENYIKQLQKIDSFMSQYDLVLDQCNFTFELFFNQEIPTLGAFTNCKDPFVNYIKKNIFIAENVVQINKYNMETDVFYKHLNFIDVYPKIQNNNGQVINMHQNIIDLRFINSKFTGSLEEASFKGSYLESLVFDTFSVKGALVDSVFFDVQQIDSIVLKDFSIENDYEGSYLIKSKAKQLYIDNLVIQDCNIIDSIFIHLEEVDEVVINNLIIQNTNFNNSTFLQLKKSTKASQINTLTVINCDFKNSILIYLNDFQETVINSINVVESNFADESKLLKLTKMSKLSIDDVNIQQTLLRNITNLIQIAISIETKITNFNQNYVSANESTYILYLASVQTATLSNIRVFTNKNTPLIRFTQQFESPEISVKSLDDNLIISDADVSFFQQGNANQPIINTDSKYFNISNSNFQNNICYYCTGTNIQVLRSQFNLKNVNFRENESDQGAFAILDNYDFLKEGWNTVTDCIFDLNVAISSGGGIFLKNSDIQMTNTQIINNKAKIGGGIRFLDKKPNLENANISGNTAEIYGQDVGSYVHSMRLVETNQTKPNLTKSDDPFNLQQFYIEEFGSGHSIQLSVQFLDENEKIVEIDPNIIYSNTILNELYQYSISSVPEFPFKLTLEGENYLSFTKYNVTAKAFSYNLIIISNPDTEQRLFITSSAVKRYEYDKLVEGFNIALNVSFRICVEGEIYQQLLKGQFYQCHVCEEGRYSFAVPHLFDYNKCYICPEGTLKCASNYIIIKNNYWRKHEKSLEIIQCFDKQDNCQAENSSNRFYCKVGHIGPLCDSCDAYGEVWNRSYKMQGGKQCRACDDAMGWQYYVPVVLLLILMTYYITFTMRVAMRMSRNICMGIYFRKMSIAPLSRTVIKDMTSFFVKQAMHFFQLKAIVNKIDIELPEIIQWVYTLPDWIGLPVDNLLYTMDCVITAFEYKEIPMVFMRTLWTLLIPVLYLFIVSIVYLMAIVCGKIKHNVNLIYNGMCMLMVFLTPSEVNVLSSIITCKQIGSDYYITADVSQPCYDNTHIKWLLIIGLPGFILWVLIIPMIVFTFLYKRRFKLDSIITRYRLGFLYQEYIPDRYYWQFIKLYKMLAIVIISNIFQEKIVTKLSLIGIILLIYNIASNRIRPHTIDMFNTINNHTMRLILVFIFVNIMYQNTGNIFLQIIIFLIIVIANNSYTYYLYLMILKTKFMAVYGKKVRPQMRRCKAFLPEWCCFWCKIDKDKNMAVFFNWLKVKKIVYENKGKLNELYLESEKKRKKIFNQGSYIEPKKITEEEEMRPYHPINKSLASPIMNDMNSQWSLNRASVNEDNIYGYTPQNEDINKASKVDNNDFSESLYKQSPIISASPGTQNTNTHKHGSISRNTKFIPKEDEIIKIQDSEEIEDLDALPIQQSTDNQETIVKSIHFNNRISFSKEQQQLSQNSGSQKSDSESENNKEQNKNTEEKKPSISDFYQDTIEEEKQHSEPSLKEKKIPSSKNLQKDKDKSQSSKSSKLSEIINEYYDDFEKQEDSFEIDKEK